MPVLPQKKVGLISCSGEDLAGGTLSRVSTLRVLEHLRPNETVTLCLPLFLAGDDKERAFARFYPTIAVDGCDKRCAARSTEKYSAAPGASIVVPEFLSEHGLDAPRNRRQMDVAGELAADVLAQAIARRVDEILGHSGETKASVGEGESVSATCSCGSGIPMTRLKVAGRDAELAALPLIFEQFQRENRSVDELFDAVRIYNAIPAGLETAYRDALREAYVEYCSKREVARSV